VSQSLIVSMGRDICELSMENHFLDLDLNVILIIEFGLKEFFRQMIVYTKLRWVVIWLLWFCFVKNFEDWFYQIVTNCCRFLYMHSISKKCS
jgi:hypothetical protein